VNVFGRRLFNWTAGISLALCVLSVAWTIRSHWREDMVALESDKKWELISDHGIFQFSVLTQYPYKYAPPASWTPTGPAEPVSPRWQFEHYSSVTHYFIRTPWYPFFGGRHGEFISLRTSPVNLALMPVGIERIGPFVAIPAWTIVLVTGALPGIWIVLARKRALVKKRAAQSLCIHCGYDLRATPDRCPECGAINSPSSNPAPIR
jgi:hypothetical protein